MHRSVLFWIGDWLLAGEQKYGEKYTQAVESTGYTVQTLMNAHWVCSRIEFSRRTGELTFGHHQEVAPLEPKEQDRLLEAAVNNAWSVRELRDEVKKKKNPEVPPAEENSVESISSAAITYLERVTKDLKRSEVAQVLAAINNAFGVVRQGNGAGIDAERWGEKIL